MQRQNQTTIIHSIPLDVRNYRSAELRKILGLKHSNGLAEVEEALNYPPTTYLHFCIRTPRLSVVNAFNGLGLCLMSWEDAVSLLVQHGVGCDDPVPTQESRLADAIAEDSAFIFDGKGDRSTHAATVRGLRAVADALGTYRTKGYHNVLLAAADICRDSAMAVELRQIADLMVPLRQMDARNSVFNAIAALSDDTVAPPRPYPFPVDTEVHVD